MAITNTVLLAGPVQVRSPSFGTIYLSTVQFDIEAPLTAAEDMEELILEAVDIQGDPGDTARARVLGMCDGGGDPRYWRGCWALDGFGRSGG